MAERARLLFANEAFYEAFRNRDLMAMEALWARQAPVACIHPGWDRLSGREAVIASWRGIFANPGAPQVVCRGAQAHLLGESGGGEGGYVLCYEVIGPGVQVATNVFVREAGSWKMVHHQAGPCGLVPAALPAEPEPPSVQ
jgi:ketosteroid isomerase-like protein